MWTTHPTSPRRKQLPTDWQARHQAIITRDGGHCVQCGAPGTDIDHITRDNNHNLDNLRLLCRSCHMRHTGRDGGHAPHKPRTPRLRPPKPHPGLTQENPRNNIANPLSIN